MTNKCTNYICTEKISKDEYKRKNKEPIKRFRKKKNIGIRRWNFENF